MLCKFFENRKGILNEIFSSARQLVENRNTNCFTITFHAMIMNVSAMKKLQVAMPDVINKLKNCCSTYFEINVVFKSRVLEIIAV